MFSFIARNLTEIEAVAGCTFACISNTVFRMFSCLQINCQPFYLRQLLKFHPFDWMIEICLQTEGQGAHHKMVTLQPMSGFSPLFPYPKDVNDRGHGFRSGSPVTNYPCAPPQRPNTTCGHYLVLDTKLIPWIRVIRAPHKINSMYR